MRPVVRVLLILASACAAWLSAYALLSRSGLSASRQAAVRAVLDGTPSYALIVLGCYAAASVGAAFWSFRDCSAEAEALQTVRTVAESTFSCARVVARVRVAAACAPHSARAR
jgi:hypothetical protein